MCGARISIWGARGARVDGQAPHERSERENFCVRVREPVESREERMRTWAASPSAGDVLRARVEAGTVGGVWARVRMPMRGVHSAIPLSVLVHSSFFFFCQK